MEMKNHNSLPDVDREVTCVPALQHRSPWQRGIQRARVTALEHKSRLAIKQA